MRIGELAGVLGLNTKTIRYYESIDVLPAPERTTSGYRDYGAEDVERLSFVRTAQRLGLTLDEIREVIAFRDRGERPCGHVQGILRRQVAELGRRIEEMQQLRDDLSRLDEDAERIRQTPKHLLRTHRTRRRRKADGRAGRRGSHIDRANGPTR